MRIPRFLKICVALLTVFNSINLPAASAGCHSRVRFRRNVVKIIEVQKVAQFVAIPVNPYYFSYNNISAIGYGGGYSSSAILANYAVTPVAQQPIIPPQPIQPGQYAPQPGQYGPGQQQQTGQTPQQPSQQSEDKYVTKDEFRDFANKVFRALDIPEEVPAVTPTPDNGGSRPPVGNQVPSLDEVVGILQANHCGSCHTGPNSKGSNGRSFPIFMDGRIVDNLNWDRIATKMLTQSMPPADSGHPPVPTQDAFRVSLFADQATR